MNKLLTKIVGAALGLTMTVGVGVAVASQQNSGVQKAEADTIISWSRVTSASTLLEGGTFIIGYESTANSGTIIPMANTGSATTSAAGFIYTGSSVSSGGTGTINMNSLAAASSSHEVEIGESSVVEGAVYIKLGSNYLGNTNTKNNCKLFASQSKTTSFKPTFGSNDSVTLDIEENTSGNAYRYLKYNTGAPRFAVYSTTPDKVVIYKKVVSQSSATVYTVTDSISHGSIGLVTSVEENAALNLTITADTHYSLPSSISVTIGGTPYNGFSYNSSTGEFSIAANVINGNVVISGSCVEDTKYDVTYTAGAHGSGTDYVVEEYDGTSHSLVSFGTSGLSADSGYRFKCWSIGGNEYNPAAVITVNADITVTAVFEVQPLEAEYVFTDKDLHYTANAYGGTWSSSPAASSFESASPSRGLQFGAAVGEGALTLNISGLTTFNNYAFSYVSLIVSTNGTANANSLAVSVGGTPYTIESETTYLMPKENNYEVKFEGNANAGNVVISFNDTNKSVYIKSISIGLKTAQAITNSRMTAGTVSASTGDEKWTLSGFLFEVSYDNGVNWETVNATYTVSLPVPTITADDTLDVTVTGTYGTASQTSGTIHATLTFVNLYSIARLYDIELALNGTQDNVTFDGIYMGESGGGFIVMNGEYGMMVYGSHDVSGYTVGETYLTVTGTLKNYNYLYEINNDSDLSFSVLTDATRKSHVEAPSTYVVTGAESSSTLYLANRKTSLSGTVYSIGGVTTAGTTATSGSNNTVLVTVGGNNVILYVKAAQATAEVAAKIVVGDPITVEGFTTYFKSNNVATFEVMFNEIIEADANYHAADFAKDLLKLTRTICAASDEGNGSALTSVWTELAGADHWLKVEANGEESALINGTPSSSIVVPNTDAGIDAMSDADAIAAALYRYDWCTAKYHLTNFMGRELTVSFGSRVIINNNASYTAPIVAIVSVITLSAVAGFFMLRKRKEQ